MVRLINIETGEVINTDEGELQYRGIPVGFSIAALITTDEWIEAFQKLREQKKEETYESYFNQP